MLSLVDINMTAYISICGLMSLRFIFFFFFFFQAEDGIRDVAVTGVQTCALPISPSSDELPNRRAARRRAPDRGLLALEGRNRAAAACAAGRPSGERCRSRREIGRASCRERV